MTKTETATMNHTGVGVKPIVEQPVCGPVAEAQLLRAILAELKTLNANLAPKTPKVEHRAGASTKADRTQGS